MPLVKKWDGTGHYFDTFVKSFSRKNFPRNDFLLEMYLQQLEV